jgi:MoaA/NifB/PqqE/SkfB family radical SAM enzyme
MLNEELEVITETYDNPNKGKDEIKIRQLASTVARMLQHSDRFPEIRKDKKIRPITIHLAPTDACNLSCSWCSTAKRAKNVMSFNEAKGIIDTYVDLGIKSMEFTGGGDPTVWEHLADTIHYAKDEKNIDVAMITNGLLLDKIEEDALKKLTWMRISLSGIEFGHQDNIYLNLDTSRFPDFYGCSFVITPQTMKEEFLNRVDKVATYLKAKYVRVVPDCYDSNSIHWARDVVPKVIAPYPNFSLQTKDNLTPPKCYWKYIKPFINSDGYVYQCSTNSLFQGKFDHPFRVAHWTEVKEIYEKPLESFDTSNCPYCFFTNQNQILSDLLVDVKHKNFF